MTAQTILSPAWKQALRRRLLAWFDRSARELPWRETRDLYAIWVSEVMLQQTQVATVVPYYERFLARFPNAAALAQADEQEVLRYWEGLGYYRRARQLHAAARRICELHGGRFPQTFAEVRALPGIGRYTAGAILSIGLDQRLPILEANSIRVLARLTSYAGDPLAADGQRHLWSVAEEILPQRRCGAFNQALMELGSEVCRPRAPACEQCPVAGLCQARLTGQVAQIPAAARPTRYQETTEVAVVVRHGPAVLLRHCQAGERWAGLWDFPRFTADEPLAGAELETQIRRHIQSLAQLEIEVKQRLAILKHGVTRFRITLHCYEAELAAGSRRRRPPAGSPVRWVGAGDLAEYPLCVTGRKITRLL